MALRDLDTALQGENHAKKIRQDIEQLASIGSYGTQPGNCSHQLMTNVIKPSLVEATFLRLPLKLKNFEKGPVWLVKQAILLPHMLFSVMGNSYKEAYGKLICPSRARLEQFWAHMRGNPQLEGFSRRAYMDRFDNMILNVRLWTFVVSACTSLVYLI